MFNHIIERLSALTKRLRPKRRPRPLEYVTPEALEARKPVVRKDVLWWTGLPGIAVAAVLVSLSAVFTIVGAVLLERYILEHVAFAFEHQYITDAATWIVRLIPLPIALVPLLIAVAVVGIAVNGRMRRGRPGFPRMLRPLLGLLSTAYWIVGGFLEFQGIVLLFARPFWGILWCGGIGLVLYGTVKLVRDLQTFLDRVAIAVGTAGWDDFPELRRIPTMLIAFGVVSLLLSTGLYLFAPGFIQGAEDPAALSAVVLWLFLPAVPNAAACFVSAHLLKRYGREVVKPLS